MSSKPITIPTKLSVKSSKKSSKKSAPKVSKKAIRQKSRDENPEYQAAVVIIKEAIRDLNDNGKLRTFLNEEKSGYLNLVCLRDVWCAVTKKTFDKEVDEDERQDFLDTINDHSLHLSGELEQYIDSIYKEPAKCNCSVNVFYRDVTIESTYQANDSWRYKPFFNTEDPMERYHYNTSDSE